ncbi:MAG: sensor histidine kinase [Bacteroidales bacterium]|nr:sensor histidine kinase [Bacteroidales bacterium]
MFIASLKNLLSIFLLMWIILPLNVQGAKNAKLDSLLKVHPVDTLERFNNYVTLSYYYNNSNLEIQKVYLDSSKLLINSLPDTFSFDRYYTSLGHYFYRKENFDSALLMYRSSLDYIDTVQNKYFTGKTYINIGRVFSRVDSYDSAIYYYMGAVAFFDAIDTTKRSAKVEVLKANSFTNIGSVYLNMGNYDESIKYYYNAIRIYDKYNNSLRSTPVLVNIGNIYLYHKEYDKALIEYDKAYQILLIHSNRKLSTRASVLTNMGVCYKAQGLVDTAMVCYEKALLLREKTGPMNSIAGLYDNIGNIYKSQGDYKSALEYYQQALTIRKRVNAPRWLASSYASIGLLYAEEKKSRKAIGFLKRAVTIADTISLVEVSLECKKGLSQIYSDLGDYKTALAYYVEYRELNDSIHSLKLEEKLNEYKQKYESEKKDRMIGHLEELQKIGDLKAEKQKEVNKKQGQVVKALSVAAIFLVFILFILYRYFKMKRTADRELFEKNEQINHQKTLKLMKDLEMSSIKSFVDGQEKERSRIAGDLHDRLGSLLSTVRLHFNSLEEVLDENPNAKQGYEYAMQLLDKSVAEVRAVSHNLSKGVLTQFGLIAAVENMRDAINSAGKIQMEVISMDVVSRLDSEVEIHLFRVIQELITNVMRHSQADEVVVQFSGNDKLLSVTVEDHGVGFDVKNIKSDGIGMTNIKKRIDDINGSMTIDSIIDQGTTIVIDVPYKVQPKAEDSNDEQAEEDKSSD